MRALDKVRKDPSCIAAFLGNELVNPSILFQLYDTIYPGSFNPPHVGHVLMSDNSLPVICLNHQWKGDISNEECIHRIKMLDLCNRPVLFVNNSNMEFLDRLFKYHMLEKQSFRDNRSVVNYRISSDAFNKCLETDQTIGCTDFHFQVVKRGPEGDDVDSIDSQFVDWEYYPLATPNTSSTVARNGDYDRLNYKVAEYIERNRLYGKS